MSMYGAVPSELRALGLRLAAQIEAIGGIRETVFTALASTTWVGPARAAFEENWNSRFNPALEGLSEAFGAVGLECANRADGLEQVMGNTTAAG